MPLLGSGGLTGVKTPDLRALLRFVHNGELPCPVTQIGLATVGLLRLGDSLEVLRNLDEHAVRAVLVSVLNERR